jgi:type I restriction enzyme S subunit
VAILQKADEIRRKRKEALETVEAIRRSLFLEMFGDPASNPKGWPTCAIGRANRRLAKWFRHGE